MKATTAETLIAAELFSRMVNGIEQRLNSESFSNEVRYHANEINNALQKDFKTMVEILQSVVDKFYFGYHEVNSFISFNTKDFKAILKHNLEIVAACKKLAKFIG